MSARNSIRAVLSKKLALLLLLPLALTDLAMIRLTQQYRGNGGLLVFADNETLFFEDYMVYKQLPNSPSAWDIWSVHPDAYWVWHWNRISSFGIWTEAIVRERCSLDITRLSDQKAIHDPVILETAKAKLQASDDWPYAPNAPPVQYTIIWGGVARHLFSPLLLIATFWSLKLNAQRLIRRRREELLRRRICPSCRYNIANLPGETLTCPECGSTWTIETSTHNNAPEPAPGR